MRPPAFLAELLERVADLGWLQTGSAPSEQSLSERCTTLLTGRGEATGLALAKDILADYATLDREEKRAFLIDMSSRFGVDEARFQDARAAWETDRDPLTLRAIHLATEPASQDLIRRLNRAPHGTRSLVAMRADLLGMVRDAPELKSLDADFHHLLSSWFNRGFLELRRIDWNTPADVLERIIGYEAVHAIAGWDDLRRRVAATDRRLYAFFHPALEGDPLIFVEVALMEAIPGRIGAILDPDRKSIDPAEARTAIFYSISNCQAGLKGVSFGNFLIKQVVEELQREFPALKEFVTLSPVPGLRRWARAQLAKPDGTALTDEQRRLVERLENGDVEAETSAALAGFVAAYLSGTDGDRSGSRDPVARFHLGNGARLERVNLGADTSEQGRANSWGVMVNYLYDLGSIVENHEAFAEQGRVVTSAAVRKLAASAKSVKETRMPEPNYLVTCLRAASVKQSDTPFVTDATGRSLSHAELWAGAERMAAALKASGVAPGDRVAVQVEKSVMVIELYLGVIMAGAVFLPLNTGYTASEIAYFLGDAKPALFVCDPARLSELTPVAETAGVGKVLTLTGNETGSLADLVGRQKAGFVPVSRKQDDLAAILYTSGTTGRSKGAMLSHGNLASNAETLAKLWRFTNKDVLIHALPVFHTHGLFVAINVTLVSGAAMLLHRGFNAQSILADMKHATALMGVPTFYTRLLALPELNRETTRNMRLFVSGSAPLLAETHTEWQARTGHAILERYGMTETNMNSSNPCEGPRKPGTVGQPLPGVDIRVADPDSGKPLPEGEIGSIEIKGPNVFKGYWQMPEKTAAEFRSDGFFISGDLGKFDADGYLSIVGRSKDLIITGGYNVYPKEIEEEIDALDGVTESAIIGIPHADFGEAVVAVVVPQGGADLKEQGILDAIAPRLARYKQPKRVFFADSLPRNTMGKVQKNLLRDRYGATFSNG